MWILLGLISAFTDAFANVLAKYNTKTFDPMVVAWAWTAYSLIILIPVMFLVGIPPLDATFWLAFTIRTVLDVTALILYVKALKYTDLSLSLPLLSLTPLFLLFTGLVINGDFPGPAGVVGVAAILVGTYWLYSSGKGSFYRPFLAIYQNKGAFLMLIVAVLWGFTAPLHKVAITHSNAYFYTAFGSLVVALILTPLAAWSNRQDFQKALRFKNFTKVAPVGVVGGISVLTQMIAQGMAAAMLVLSVKRTSIVFSSLMGGYFFGEPLKKRIVPICLMVLGVVLISLSWI